MKKRTVIIYRKDIEYDLTAITQKIFNAREGDNIAKNQLRYESTTDNQAMLARYMRKHYAKVGAVLKPYLRTDIQHEVQHLASNPRYIENISDEATHESYRDLTNDIEYVCYFPENWDNKQFELLSEGIYEYILNKIVCDFVKVAPSEMRIYLELAEEGYKNIIRAITSRIHPQTRGRFPYDTI